MTTLTQASRQWASRPADERFTSLLAMRDSMEQAKRNSRQTVSASRWLAACPVGDSHGEIEIIGRGGGRAAPSHWAFGQLAALAEAPAGYLRTMPSEIVADCINYGLQYKRQVEDVGVLLTRSRSGDVAMRAATGPRYGRIWNLDICQGLVDRFGDGLTGDFRVPGEFGQRVDVTQANTTLFAGDRDMFVFLADEVNRVDLPVVPGQASPGRERRGLARGFFCWNSEVGSATLGIATFLFDYVCCNRMVWGATRYRKITLRHTPKAPVRWLDEVAPALAAYREDSTKSIVECVTAAQRARIDNVDDFLAKRFGAKMPAKLQDISVAEEGKPIETIWDAVTAATAYARGIQWQDERVGLETKAGQLLDLASGTTSRVNVAASADELDL